MSPAFLPFIEPEVAEMRPVGWLLSWMVFPLPLLFVGRRSIIPSIIFCQASLRWLTQSRLPAAAGKWACITGPDVVSCELPTNWRHLLLTIWGGLGVKHAFKMLSVCRIPGWRGQTSGLHLDLWASSDNLSYRTLKKVTGPETRVTHVKLVSGKKKKKLVSEGSSNR